MRLLQRQELCCHGRNSTRLTITWQRETGVSVKVTSPLAAAESKGYPEHWTTLHCGCKKFAVGGGGRLSSWSVKELLPGVASWNKVLTLELSRYVNCFMAWNETVHMHCIGPKYAPELQDGTQVLMKILLRQTLFMDYENRTQSMQNL
jgi:hypothetical protein